MGAMQQLMMAQGTLTGGSHSAAPTFVADYFLDGDTVTALAPSVTIAAGDTVVIAVGAFFGATVSSISTAAGTASLLASYNNAEDSRMRTEIWGITSASSSATAVTVNFSGTTNASVSVLRYTGVSAFGNTATAGNAAGVYSDTTHTESITLQDANNRNINVGMVRNPTTATATAGVIRRNQSEAIHGSFALIVGDNTAASAGALSMTYTTSSGVLWNNVGLELRSVP